MRKGVLQAMHSTYRTGKLDLDIFAYLPVVKPNRIIYAHPGWPRAFDGPNALSPIQKLFFIGQSASLIQYDGYTGAAAKIYSRGGGAKVGNRCIWPEQ
jgi:hypothetical protein